MKDLTSAPLLLFPCLLFTATNYELNDNSTVFSPLPTSDVDVTGRRRFIGELVTGRRGGREGRTEE